MQPEFRVQIQINVHSQGNQLNATDSPTHFLKIWVQKTVLRMQWKLISDGYSVEFSTFR